ncbi:hypothetical protein GGF32_001035 [Allomyces javanicus]|nr:hypothetical protein GGF32_001035 [Allomyces javanicus]
MSTLGFSNWIEPAPQLTITDPLIWQASLDGIVVPLFLEMSNVKWARTTTVIFFLVLAGLAAWLLLVWEYQIAYLLMPLGVLAALAAMVRLVRRMECSKTTHLWRGHFDFVLVHFASYVVFRGLAVAASGMTSDSRALPSSFASFAVEFGVPALAEELAILWLSLRTHKSFMTLALVALATVGQIVFIDSGFLSDVVFAWRAQVPLRDLYGDALKQLLARQLPSYSPSHGPRLSSRTHIFRSGSSSKSAASRTSTTTISAPSPASLTATGTPGTNGPWTPRLIIQAHRRLRKHASIAPQYHLARFVAILCTVVFRIVSLQAGAPDDWIAWRFEFISIAAMAIAYLVSAAIVVALLRRKISNLGFDRARLIVDSAVPKSGGGGGCGVTPSTLSTCKETDSSNMSASSLAIVRDRRPSAKPAVPVQLLPIRVELTDLWRCTSPSLVLWLSLYAIIILLAL